MSSKGLAVVAILLSAILTTVLISARLVYDESFDVEVFRVLIQFFLITVLGGAAALLYRQLEVERDSTQRRRDARRSELDQQITGLQNLFMKVVELYYTTKRVRRFFRTKSIRTSNHTRRIRYRDLATLVDELQVCQMKYEEIQKTIPILFQHIDLDSRNQLTNKIKVADNYLQDVLKETESGTMFQKINEDTDVVDIGPGLMAFVRTGAERAAGGDSTYLSFFAALEEVRGVLSEVIEAKIEEREKI